MKRFWECKICVRGSPVRSILKTLNHRPATTTGSIHTADCLTANFFSRDWTNSRQLKDFIGLDWCPSTSLSYCTNSVDFLNRPRGLPTQGYPAYSRRSENPQCVHTSGGMRKCEVIKLGDSSPPEIASSCQQWTWIHHIVICVRLLAVRFEWRGQAFIN